jgi:hypothetical protein
MKTSTTLLALATICLAGLQLAYAGPLQNCRDANQAALKANNNSFRDANQNFLLTYADRQKYNAMVQAVIDSRDGTPTLKECQARTQKIQEITDTLAKMIAGADRELAACRAKNNAEFTRINITFDSYNSAKTTAGRGGLTPEISGSFIRQRDSMNAERVKADQRGFTMADCNTNTVRNDNLRKILESACLTNKSGGDKRCITVQ